MKRDDNNMEAFQIQNSSDHEHEREKKSRRCHVNKDTIPLKITLFLYFGGKFTMSAMLPYLTIHMRDIGISMIEMGIILALLPITAFMGPLLIGFLADKLGRYKRALVAATVINGVFHMLLLTVPKYSESMEYATAVIQFNREGPTTFDILRPLHASQCQQLISSVQQRQLNRTTYLHDVINIHSCIWGHDDWTRNNTLETALIQQMNIPQFCQQKNVDSSSNENLTLQLLCALNTMDLQNDAMKSYDKPAYNNSSSDFNSSCSIKLNLDGVTGQGVQHQITCRTNYTFPTGTIIENGSRHVTFWLYLLLRTVANIFMTSCYSLLDATILTVVNANKAKGAQYGKERMFSVMGSAIMSPLAGLLVDTVSNYKGYTDYSPAFYLANVMLFLNVIGYAFMELEVEKPEGDMWKNVTDLLRYPEVAVFLIMIFIMGNMYGFVKSFLFIYLDELKAPKYLLGLTLTIGSLVSIPFLYGAQGIVVKVGRANVIIFAFFIYLVRFIGYSYIPNPFWCFPFEAMEAFTKGLMWVAAATYCTVLSPNGLLGTLTGLIQSLHYGLGKGSGSFIGGHVISLSSSRQAFRYFGIFGGCTGLVYFLLNKLWLESAFQRRSERERGIDKKEDEIKDQTQSMLQDEEPIQVS